MAVEADPAAADFVGVEIAHVVFPGFGVVAIDPHVEEEIADDAIPNFEADQFVTGDDAVAAILRRSGPHIASRGERVTADQRDQEDEGNDPGELRAFWHAPPI